MLPWNPSPSFHGQAPGARPESGAYNTPGMNQGAASGSNGYSMQGPQAQGGYGGMYGQQQPQQPMPQPGMQQQGPPASPAAPPLSLSQVLHFLQTEYRKHERERNEWEIERAEMRARIALLEGERRASENLRSDLLRRVKMLEFALRGERSKYLSTAPRSEAGDKAGAGAASAIPPSKAAALKNEERPPSPSGSGSPPSDNGEGFSDSASSSGQASSKEPAPAIPPHLKPESLARPPSSQSLANGSSGSERAAMAPSISGSNLNGTGSLVGPGGYNPAIGRDPKGRAQARFYLKQCLQEIAYLTSPATLNPLPERGAEGMPRPPPKQLIPIPHHPQAGPSGHVPGILPAPPHLMAGQQQYTAPPRNQQQDPSIPLEPSPMSGLPADVQSISAPAMEPSSSAEMTRSLAAPGIMANASTSDASTSNGLHRYPGERPMLNGISTHEANHVGYDDGEDRLTAVFRPDAPEAWRDQLKGANPPAPEAEMSNLSISDAESDDGQSVAAKAEDRKSEHRLWRQRKVLKSHLNAVRCLATESVEPIVATGGDDCTVKVWRLNAAQMTVNNAKSSPDHEPQVTLRGHSAAVTSIAIASESQRLFSASLDQTIQIWAMPPRDREPYAPYDDSLRIGRLEGHTDAIWSIALVAMRIRNELLLASASADGTVKIWDAEKQALKLSWSYNGVDAETAPGSPIPTAVASVTTDMRKLAVGYTDSVVKLFDVETGRHLLTLKRDESDISAAQVNAIAAHPTMPTLAVAYEDGRVRVFDHVTGICKGTILAHQDAVTAVDVDPSGLSLATTGHDNSVKIWDLTSFACVQDLPSHKTKAEEGALDVKFHPKLPFLLSSGADGVVKVFVG